MDVTSLPLVADLRAYLDATGWVLRPETWHGASVWQHESGSELLVPPGDTAADNPRRLRETLELLSRVEQRHQEEILRDVTHPYADAQTYWTFPDGNSLNLETLNGRYKALGSIRRVLRAAAESLASVDPMGELSSRQISSMLDRVEILHGQDIRRFAIRVPIDRDAESEGGLHAALLPWLSGAMQLLRTELTPGTRDVAAFAEAGISATLCNALGDLTGRERDRPLRVEFRWARGRPASWQGYSVDFEGGFGARLGELASRLGTAEPTTTSATGRVESLHGQRGDGYWEVRIGGRVIERDGRDGTRRGLRLLLPSEQLYDQALEAHRNGLLVRVRGQLGSRRQRTELVVETGGFEVIG